MTREKTSLSELARVFLGLGTIAFGGPLVPRLRHSRIAGAALDGVNVAALALMAGVSWQLGVRHCAIRSRLRSRP